MKGLLIIALMFINVTCFTQSFDRISMSSGGASTSVLNFVIGETFNFSMNEGDILIETGSQGSDDYTGGGIIFSEVQDMVFYYPLECYPNPVNDMICIRTGLNNGSVIQVFIYNSDGRIVYKDAIVNKELIIFNVKFLLSGSYHLVVIDAERKTMRAQKIIKL